MRKDFGSKPYLYPQLVMIIGTYDKDGNPNAMNAANLTSVLKPKAKYLSVIGSFGWGGKLVEKLTAPFSESKIEIIEPVLVKGRAKDDDYTKLDILVNTIIDKHKG